MSYEVTEFVRWDVEMVECLTKIGRSGIFPVPVCAPEGCSNPAIQETIPGYLPNCALCAKIGSIRDQASAIRLLLVGRQEVGFVTGWFEGLSGGIGKSHLRSLRRCGVGMLVCQVG